MKKMSVSLFFLCAFLMSMQIVSAEVFHYYVIDLTYTYGEITSTDYRIEPSQKEIKTPEGEYIAEVISNTNEILNLTFFKIPRTILYDTIDPKTGEITGGGIIERNETNTTIYVPYYENAVEIVIYDWDLNKKLTIDVSDYAKEVSETEEKDTGETEIKAEVQDEEKTKALGASTFLLLAVALLLFIIMIIVMIRRERKKQ